MESASVTATGTEPVETGEKGLKKNAIGFVDGLSVGLASTAPAYSLAAVIGSIVVAVGVKAPGVLLLAFIPMFFIAAAFFYMNRVDTDCGTTFSWVTRGMGPWVGLDGRLGDLHDRDPGDRVARRRLRVLHLRPARPRAGRTARRCSATSRRSRRWPS